MADPTERNPHEITVKEYLEALKALLDVEKDDGLIDNDEANEIYGRAESQLLREGVHTGLEHYYRIVFEFPKFVARREEFLAKEEAKRAKGREAAQLKARTAREKAELKAQQEREKEAEKVAREQEKTLIERAAFRQELAEAPSFVRTATGRAQLARLVDQGFIPWETAFGRGSAWETWQREQADKFNLQREPTFDPTLSRQISGLLRQAEQEGISTTSFERSFRHLLKAFALGGAGEEDIGNTMLALSGQIQQKRAIRREQESQLLAGQFPGFFGQFQKQRGEWTPELAGDVDFNYPTTQFTGFKSFAEKQPAFKEARLQRETKMLKEFPTLFPLFQQAPISERLGGFQAFRQATPERRAFFQKIQEEKTRPRRTRQIRFARI